MHFSFKHNGLYLYFSRLVRPVWLATLVVPGTKDCPLASTVDPEEIDWIMTKLNDLAAFLEKNSAAAASAASAAASMHHHAAAGMHHVSAAQMDPAAGSMLHQQKSMQDALLRERQSMLFLQQLVSHCLQVSGHVNSRRISHL